MFQPLVLPTRVALYDSDVVIKQNGANYGYSNALIPSSSMTPSLNIYGTNFCEAIRYDGLDTYFVLTGSASQYAGYTSTSYFFDLSIIGGPVITAAGVSEFGLQSGDSIAYWKWGNSDPLGLVSLNNTTVRIKISAA
jgi:hypothetical protein